MHSTMAKYDICCLFLQNCPQGQMIDCPGLIIMVSHIGRPLLIAWFVMIIVHWFCLVESNLCVCGHVCGVCCERGVRVCVMLLNVGANHRCTTGAVPQREHGAIWPYDCHGQGISNTECPCRVDIQSKNCCLSTSVQLWLGLRRGWEMGLRQ